MKARNVLMLGLGLALALGIAGSARASCNSIPPASEFRPGFVPVHPEIDLGSGSPQPLPSGMEAAFRYKTALGRVDGVFFSPGRSERLRIAADDLCVGPPIENAAPRITDIGPIEDLAVFVAFDSAPGFSTPVWPYLADENPRITIPALRDALHELSRERARAHDASPGFGPVHFVLGDNWDTGVRGIEIAPDVDALTIAVPNLYRSAEAVAHAERASWHLASASVRILAVHVGGKNVRQLAADVGQFLQGDCSAICEKLRSSGAVACVDSIYTRPMFPDISKAIRYAKDEMLCSVDIPQLPPITLPSDTAGGPSIVLPPQRHNYFVGVCEPGKPDQTILNPHVTPVPPSSPSAISLNPVLRGCDQSTAKLKLWVSECGGIHIPLDYKNIRTRARPDGTGPVTSVKRWLYGQSGAGREFNADRKRIYVPGREFVGSTPSFDSSGTSPDTHWRLPELDVWYPDGQESAEFGLKGVADKDESIVHVFPRMRTTLVCAGVDPRACMRVDNGGTTCACEDSLSAGCSCDPVLFEGQFFACEGGDRENMPCTRDAHCRSRDTSRENGTCSRQPICRPKDTVWRRPPGGFDNVTESGTACSTDGDCHANQQCGYSLFNFRSRMEDTDNDGDGWYYLDRDVVVKTPAARTRRGACAHDREFVCSNADMPTFPEQCPDANRCRGYRLVAGEEQP